MRVKWHASPSPTPKLTNVLFYFFWRGKDTSKAAALWIYNIHIFAKPCSHAMLYALVWPFFRFTPIETFPLVCVPFLASLRSKKRDERTKLTDFLYITVRYIFRNSKYWVLNQRKGRRKQCSFLPDVVICFYILTCVSTFFNSLCQWFVFSHSPLVYSSA